MIHLQFIFQSWVKRVQVALLACAAATPLIAGAGLYKQVGPDGKVTFSDTPPVSGSSQSIAKPGASSPTSKVATPASSSTPADGQRLPASEQDAFYRNATLGAALKLKIVGALVDGIGELCVREQPEAAGAVRAARARWHGQHDPLMPVMQQILNELAPAKLRTDQERQLKTATSEQLRPLAAAPKAEQLRRCQKAASEFNGPGMNMANSPAVAKLFSDYVPGKWRAY